jgi:hypothetical protein
MLLILIIGFMSLITSAFSSGSMGYVAMPSASEAFPGINSDANKHINNSKLATLAINELRISGSIALLES